MEAAQGLCDPGCCLCGTGTVLKILLPLHWCSSPSRTVGHLSLQIQQCSFQVILIPRVSHVMLYGTITMEGVPLVPGNFQALQLFVGLLYIE